MFDELDTIPLGSGKAVKFENQFIPLIPAGRFLFSDKTDWDIQSGGMIIIVASGSERVALLIDEIVDEQEMMIKPLPDLYEHLMYVGGITFGRDGTLIPLLHVPDLIEQSHMSYGKPSGAGVSAKTVEKQIQRILVVDDSYNTREVQKHILEAHGYSVLLAGDGAEALDKLDEEDDVSLVVTDIEMPVLDGFGLVKKIRVHKTYSEIPIVILSSRESVEDRSRGVEAGANAYIVKRDFDEEKLTATLRTLLP
jgi:CheY-like chemotaxis protein